MEISKTGSFRESYEALNKELNEALNKELNQLESSTQSADLQDRVTTLFYEVARSNEDPALVKDCTSLISRLKICGEKPETIEDSEEKMRTVFGDINQFSAESNSSCTSCAQAFLRNVLPLGIAWDVTSEQVTSFIKIGLGFYYALYAQAAGEDTALQMDHYAAFSTPEICEQYGLKLGSAHPERALKIDSETGSLVPFFTRQLEKLEEGLSSEKTGVGATIHCHGNTYALAIFETRHGREYVFFDSHGNSRLNPENNNGYIKYTFSLEAMATFLAEIMPFHRVQNREETPPEQLAAMEAENNSYILYPLELSEKGILAETMEASSSSGPIPVKKDFFPDDSFKKTSSIAENIFALFAIVAACIAFWFKGHIISALTSGVKKVQEKFFPPSNII